MTTSHSIDFLVPPQIGDALMRAGQRYELVASEPYTRRDGSASVLLTWRSHCLRCGEPFEVKSGMRSKGVNRRCAACVGTAR